jgi:hypothetical protein
MGGALQACGCYDGPWSEIDATPVSVRCPEHEGSVAPLEGYVPMRKDARGVTVEVALKDRPRPAMAIPRGRKKKRSRR